ncbi:MAG TPA: hypothetical protein VNT81_13510 [Vicinamibacterales bacterium]|nr:hypothetical protein [Vicinamibacterales bacterium]
MKAGVTIAIVGIIYWLRLDPYAGLMLDDAWYMVLGKSLAMGEGFRVISSSAAAIVPSVPPGFPALLSIVFWFNPSYPDNVVLLKSISVLAMAGVGVACWWDFTRNRDVPGEQALWMAAAVALSPAFVFLATSTVMAECVFALAQLLTVIAVERAMKRDGSDSRGALAAGVFASATLLISTTGIAAVAASVVYLAVHRRWRQAAIFAATVALLLLPWQAYSRANAPTMDERITHGGSIAYSDGQETALEHSAADNLVNVLTRDIGAVVLPVLFRPASESGQEVRLVGPFGRGTMGGAPETMVISALLVVVMLVGVYRSSAWLSLPVLLIASSLVMFATASSLTTRYVLPLAPFLSWLLWRGFGHAKAARMAVLVVLGLQLFDHTLYIREKTSGMPRWIAEAREVDDVLSWMAGTLREDGAVASSNPGLVFLRTGRKGIVSVRPDPNWDTWRRTGIRYVATLRPDEIPLGQLNTVRILFHNGRLWVVRL